MAKYGCEVFAFDPSMGKEDHKHGEGVMFFNQALSDINQEKLSTSTNDSDQYQKEAWKSRTLATTIEELGHSQVIFMSVFFFPSESFNVYVCFFNSRSPRRRRDSQTVSVILRESRRTARTGLVNHSVEPVLAPWFNQF